MDKHTASNEVKPLQIKALNINLKLPKKLKLLKKYLYSLSGYPRNYCRIIFLTIIIPAKVCGIP